MNLTIAAVFKRLTPFEKQWIDTYLKRLQTLCKTSLVHIKESGADSESSKQKIGQQLEKIISPGAVVCLLDEKGKRFGSQQLADHLSLLEQQACKELIFIVGGAHGHPDAIIQRADLMLRLSDFTLAHRLALLVLSEQLYRAYSIKKGLPYHHV
ncbi:MAG: 23S rRNA (pseudouridine(1915)-N(3))-methyltransferase RlmH [Bdellovibrionales bacterium]|nr:23S rRNA (pseudouridine(1915)-N(3))-methyltransferase RlmH [Bdellovibrionales bacterium]